MNTKKLLSTISLLLIGFNLAYAAPVNFCLLQKGDKQIKIWGDLHEEGYRQEKLGFDIFDRNINHESVLKGKKCWAIESGIRSINENIVEFYGSNPVPNIIEFLQYKAVQQKMVRENIDFKFMYHGVNTDITSQMGFLLTHLCHSRRDFLCAKYDKYLISTASCSIQELMVALEDEIAAMINYFRLMKMSDESRKAIDTMILNLDITMKNLKDHYNALKRSSELKEDFFTIGWVEAFKKYACSQTKIDLMGSLIHYLLSVKVRMGDLNFIIKALKYLEQYNDITLYVGGWHAYTLRGFFINNGFIQSNFVGSHYIQRPAVRGALEKQDDPLPSLLSIEDIEKIYVEILKDAKADAELKINAQLAATKKAKRKKIIRNVTIGAAVAAAVVGAAWWLIGWKKTQKRAA